MDDPTLPRSHAPTLSGFWAPFVLAVATAGFSVLNPLLLILVPFAFMLVALEPRKPFLLLIAFALLLSAFTGKATGALWWYSRGWALMVSAWFILAVVFLPEQRVFARALAAVAGATVTVALLFVINRAAWHTLDATVANSLRSAANDVVAFWTERAKGKTTYLANLQTAINRFAEFQALAYPALLSIASVSGLSVAWWLWRRFSVQEPRPLGVFRDFRFTDELVWLVVVGAALVLLPLHEAATRTGTNLLTFMGALYVLRGFAVMLTLFGAPSLIGGIIGVVVLLLLYPIVMATTLMVGLTDTWLDLRARRITRQDNEKH